MRYADRDGNIYEEENGQDRLLHWMYTTMAGRASLKILIRPWVSKLGGAFLSSPISKCLIKGFVKNNHIDMSEYEKKNYKSYNEFFSRKIKEGKRPFPEDKTSTGGTFLLDLLFFSFFSFLDFLEDTDWAGESIEEERLDGKDGLGSKFG